MSARLTGGGSAGTTEHVVLLRGINVGRAKRVPMAELRELLGELGCTSVRTLLNSGNAVVQTPTRSTRKLAAAIEAALHDRFGFEVAVFVHTAAELAAIVAAYPFGADERDPSKLLVAFVAEPADLKKIEPLLSEEWGPDELAIGNQAAYVWCAGGILESRLLKQVGRLLGGAVTTRNWATILKLEAATGA